MIGFRSSFVKPFMAAWLSLVSLLILIVGGFFYSDFHSELQIKVERERSQVLLGAKLIENRLDDVVSDVLFMSQSVSLIRYAKNSDQRALDDLGYEFHNASCLKGKYDQIRFLDKSGQERLRVNYRDGACERVAEEKLQNKGNRYYFGDTYKLKRGGVFISPLDLNIEHGVIERPLKPVIRIGTPVFDDGKNKFGIVLVNYFGKDLINDLSSAMSGSDGTPLLLNRDGYWLLGANREDEWGFMFKNDRLFKNSHPHVWRRMEDSNQGQMTTADGIFTWQTVYPLAFNTISSTGSSEALSPSSTYIDRNAYFWKVVTHIPNKYITEWRAKRIRMAFVLLTLLISLAFAAAYFIGRSRERELASIEALRESEYRQRAITAKLAEGLMVLDENAKLITMNPEAERLLGWSGEMLAGQKIHDRIYPDSQDEDKPESPIIRVLNEVVVVHMEEDVFIRSDGTNLPVAYTASPYIVDDEVKGIIVAFEDISERKRIKEELLHRATHDALTGLLNRHEIEKLLGFAFKHAKRYETELSVCMMDIDHFKSINDTLGHLSGDEVLRQVGAMLKATIRSSDLAGRYGGEEFLVVLTQTPLEGAEKWAEHVRRKIESNAIRIKGQDKPITVTLSMGVAVLADYMVDPEQLVHRADHAMYTAKASGRNQVRVDTEIES